MLRSIGAALLLALFLSACNTVAPNRLSVLETADLRFTSVKVVIPETAPFRWSSAEYEYMRARGITSNDPALLETPDARAGMRDIAAQRLRTAIERAVAERTAGGRPVSLVATVTQIEIASPVQRALLGSGPTFIKANIDIVDARTNTVLTTYHGGSGSQYSGQGVVGLVVDAALEAGGRDDLFDRTATDYAKRFGTWLATP